MKVVDKTVFGMFDGGNITHFKPLFLTHGIYVFKDLSLIIFNNHPIQISCIYTIIVTYHRLGLILNKASKGIDATDALNNKKRIG